MDARRRAYKRYNSSPKGKARARRYHATDTYREWNRERMMMVRNPRREAYRRMGLEQFNLLTKGAWRG